MSIINQMLRDLDARGAAAADVRMARNDVPVKTRRVNLRMAMLMFLLLAVAGGLGYFLLSGTMHGGTKPTALAVARHEPVSVPETAMSPVHDERPPAPEADHAERAAIPATAPATLKPPTVMAGKMTQTLAKPLTPKQAMSVAVVANNEPAVVKKMADLTPEAEAQQYYENAQALRRAAKPDAAMSQYRLALARNPGMQSARLQLARLLQESGQVDAALSLLKVGYDQQQDGALAIATGRLLADQGRRDEALIWLARGGETLRPADRALMGALLSQASRYVEAVKAYQRALASDPDQGGWSLGLGLALESLGRVGEARAAYRNALDKGTFNPEVVKFLRQKIDASGL
jgi:MSHA biogenesis protein MshN